MENQLKLFKEIVQRIFKLVTLVADRKIKNRSIFSIKVLMKEARNRRKPN